MAHADFRGMLIDLAPPWLQGPYGSRLMYSIGLVLDAMGDLIIDGVAARLPGIGTVDALDEIGSDREIIRGPAESDDSYAARLTRAFDDWAHAGSPNSRMSQLQAYLTPVLPLMRNVFVDNDTPQTAVWHELPAGDPDGDVTVTKVSPTNWDWDGNAAEYWRFYPIIDATDVWVTDGTWADSGTWDDGGTWDSTATPEEVATIRLIVNQWRAAQAHCQWIIVAFDPADFSPSNLMPPSGSSPNGTWGHWGRDDAGNRVIARDETASYWDGPG